MKHFFWIFVAIYASVMMVACNKNSGGDPGAVNTACAAYNFQGLCVDANGVVIQSGLVPSTLAYFADNWSQQKSISILDSSTYKNFLRTAMGVCDRTETSIGSSSCSAWATGGLDIVINPTGASSAYVTFRTWPTSSQYGSYWGNFPDLKGFLLGFIGVPPMQTAGVYLNPMVLNTYNQGAPQTVFPVNNSAGFEIRLDGPVGSFGNRSMIQIRVDQGKIGDNSFTFKLGYPSCLSSGGSTSCAAGVGTWFAQGTLNRCVTPGCTGGTFW